MPQHIFKQTGALIRPYVDLALKQLTPAFIGLGEVNNTSDANKPISVATQAALDLVNVGKADTIHRHDVATTSVPGFMSSADKIKLEAIPIGANCIVPVASTDVLGCVKDGTGVHIADDGTLSVDFGTTAGTVTQGNDSRLSDAREWAAPEVTKSEAEAGVSTTLGKWSAIRVTQAIAAWWDGIVNTVVQKSDIGVESNKIPLNQYLGETAYVDLTVARDFKSTGWSDMISPLSSAGVPSNLGPNLTVFTVGTVIRREYAFSVGDLLYVTPFHLNHDIKPNGQAFIHIHWATNGTSTNTVKWRFDIIRAKGHNQENFTQVPSLTVEQAASAGTAYRHMVAEVTTPLIMYEPDELILITVTRISNGSNDNPNTIFGLMVDLHYESDRHSTPNRVPNFFG